MIILTVDNDKSTFGHLYYFQISTGAEVLQIIATDADNNPLTYRLDPDDVFRIDNNGMITTRDTQLDREGTAMYVIDVIVGDLNSDGSSGPESGMLEECEAEDSDC